MISLNPRDPAFLRILSLSPSYLLHSSSINNLLPQSSSLNCGCAAILAAPLHQRRTNPALWRSTIQFPKRQTPKKTHTKSLESPTVRAVRKMRLSSRPQTKNFGLREGHISSSKDERSGIDKRIIRRPPPPPHYDCRDVSCTWPCAHHFHGGKDLNFMWYPELEHCPYQHPEIPRFRSEMKDCQFCRIFFTIGQGDCRCGANSRNDHIPLESGGCRCKFADCYFRSNGQLSRLDMRWICGPARYELGLPTGKVV